jgi:hypothetical protein
MTDETVISPDTVTDAQVDEFFSSGGEIKAEPKEEPKPEKVEEKPVEPVAEEKEEKEEKKVNLGALHEERARRKAEAARAAQAEKERDELRALLANKQKPEPQYDEDPVEVLRRESEQMKQILLAQANKALSEKKESDYWAKVAADEKAFKAEKPDFDAAIKYLADSRLEELKDLGWDDEAASKILGDEIKWISDKAYEDEVNPAERFYALAKRRGFAAKSPEEAKKPDQAEVKLETIKKGMETNKNLPQGSKTSKQDLTAEALADMKVDALSGLHSKTEFDKAWDKLFG